MKNDKNKLFTCRLCKNKFFYDEMSEEHYPARSVGNIDVGNFNLTNFIDLFQSNNIKKYNIKQLATKNNLEKIADEIFDKNIFKSTYPNGRTARTLCKKCNNFLGKYDEAYLKFFKADGLPKIVRGFMLETKYEIIKSIFAKFLSVPETKNEKFDFINFIKDKSICKYNGEWQLYFVRRDSSTDIMGLSDLNTGKLEYDEGVVYELSDEKFIFNLMNFKKHDCFEMNNIFDITMNNYSLITGVGENGGYHGLLLIQNTFDYK